MAKNLLGSALVLASAIGFSAKAVLVKLAYSHGVDPVTLLALRMLFSLPFFLALLFFLGAGDQWLPAALLGLIGFYLSSFLDFEGLTYLSAGLERMVLMLYPTMVVLFSALIFRHKVTRRQALALVLCYSGIVLAFIHDVDSDQNNLLLGSILVLGAGFCYALYLIGSGRMISQIGAQRFTAIAMSGACLASLLQFFALRPASILIQPHQVYGLALAMAVFSTVLPAFLLAEGMKRIGASQAALINSAGPPMTIFLAHFLLAEAISALQIMGLGLVLSGALLISMEKR